MEWEKHRIGVRYKGRDFSMFFTDKDIEARPGQFVFARLPGVGAKPFAVADDEPLSLFVQENGYFTNRFNKLQQGDEFYVSGPFGRAVDVSDKENVVLVGGGCGIAGICHKGRPQ